MRLLSVAVLSSLALSLAACGTPTPPATLPPVDNLQPTVAALQTQLAAVPPASPAAPTQPNAAQATPDSVATQMVGLQLTQQAVISPPAGEPSRSFNTGATEVFQVALSPQGPWLAAATAQGVQIWDVNAGTLARTLSNPPTSWAMDVTFSGDGRRLAAVSNEQLVWVWDTTTWQLTDQLQGGGYHTTVALNADGSFLAAAGLDTTIYVWRLAEYLPALGGHTTEVTDLVFTNDSSRLLSASTDGTVRLYNPNDRAFYRSFGYRLGPIWGLALNAQNTTFAAADEHGVVAQWDLNSYQPVARAQTNASGLTSLAYLPDGRQLLTGARDGAVQIWDGAHLARTLRASGPSVNSVALTSDGRVAAAAGLEGSVSVWNLGP